MLKVQHIGIATQKFKQTLEWYLSKGFNIKYQTILYDKIKVAFIDIYSVIIELYEEEISFTGNPIISKIVVNTKDTDELLISPSGEQILLKKFRKIGLDHIVINTTSIMDTYYDLKKHGFKKENLYLINGNVKFLLNKITNKCIGSGSINHIAFDSTDLDKKLKEISDKGIPIVEGINYLPFFSNGVKYFVTENFNGLRLEYNQIIK